MGFRRVGSSEWVHLFPVRIIQALSLAPDETPSAHRQPSSVLTTSSICHVILSAGFPFSCRRNRKNSSTRQSRYLMNPQTSRSRRHAALKALEGIGKTWLRNNKRRRDSFPNPPPRPGKRRRGQTPSPGPEDPNASYKQTPSTKRHAQSLRIG